MSGHAGVVLEGFRVIPVVSFDALDEVLPVADALLAGGLTILEVTLRTATGLPAIEHLRSARPELTVGAASVWDPEQFTASCAAGAAFVVSPGTTDALFAHAPGAKVPWLPGGATITELGRIRAAGYGLAKLFPAAAIGGLAMAAAIADVLPDIKLCPTGGLDAESADRYLAQPNVACVAGSWVAPRELIRTRDWPAITARARVATRG